MNPLSFDQFDNYYEHIYSSPLRLIFYLGFFTALPIILDTSLATEILIFGLFALSFNFLFGFSGLLSFGHALFFGMGAYLSALMVIHWNLPMLVIFTFVLIISLIYTFILGLISLQLSGVYFAMITLAFAQFFYELAISLKSITGGETGLVGIGRTSLIGTNTIEFSSQISFYGLVMVFGIAILYLGHLISQSTFGRTLRAVNDNEERTRALGVNTYRVKVIIFTISGTIATLCGALWALYLRYVSPETFFWMKSGDAVLYSIIGGINSLFGPLAGSASLRWLEDSFFVTQPGKWNLLLGTVFLIFVMFARGGIIGILEAGMEHLLESLPFENEGK